MLQLERDYPALKPLEVLLSHTGANGRNRRILAELRFASLLNETRNGLYEAELHAALQHLEKALARDETLTNQAMEEVEALLSPLAADAKAYRYLCVAHAHIDMNWMWGYDETVGATLDTFGTMLALMEEYPTFTFSQSQASVYRIVEEHDPDMFETIRRRIREGRWEVTASTWVETDKNMPNGESLSRHILYTKEYMQRAFDLDPDGLEIDFEPDTFGHTPQVPEILVNGGVKYYYQCRGHLGDQILYRWRGPSGAEVLAYCEPFWYNADVDDRIADHTFELEKRTGGKTLMKVYGVGNHGGGPTRRDVELLLEMDTWPIYPAFEFGTLRDYFHSVLPRREAFPLKQGELNFLCDGCYTTQTRIKAGNRKSEAMLMETEWLAAYSSLLTGGDYPTQAFSEAWTKTLFNQFHDILPGSGVTETREYASALYQEVFASARAKAKIAARRIMDRIDTRSMPVISDVQKVAGAPDSSLNVLSGKPGHADEQRKILLLKGSRAEGGGAGSGSIGRGAGLVRVFHLFNPSALTRTEVMEITVWDYEGDKTRLIAMAVDGTPLPTQILEQGTYWDHTFTKLLTEATVPATGYTTVLVTEDPVPVRKTGYDNDMRVQTPDAFILENDRVRAELDPQTGAIRSFRDKKTGEEMADATRGMGTFRWVHEASEKAVTSWKGGMSAWFVGRYRHIENVNTHLEMRPVETGPVRSAIRYRTTFGNSSLQVTVSLDKDSTALRFTVECDWREFGSPTDGIPALHFLLPVPFRCPNYLYEVPFAMVERTETDMDLPSIGCVVARTPEKQHGWMLTSKSKYGFRCHGDQMALTLIRGACDPDPTPETGHHHIEILAGLIDASADNARYLQLSASHAHPFDVHSGTVHGGDLPLSGGLFHIEQGTVALSGVKMPQEAPASRTQPAGSASPVSGEPMSAAGTLMMRLYETDGHDTDASLRFSRPVASASHADGLERDLFDNDRPRISEDGQVVSFRVKPHQVVNLRLQLR